MKQAEEWTPARIRSLLDALGWTQSQAAEYVGVELRALQRWIADETVADSARRRPRGAACKMLERMELELVNRRKK